MAIVSRVIGIAAEPEGVATIEVDYDDVDLRIRTVRVVNNHPTFSFRAYARRSDGTGPPYDVTVLPLQTVNQNVPTSPAQRLQYTINPVNGRLDNVGVGFNWVLP